MHRDKIVLLYLTKYHSYLKVQQDVISYDEVEDELKGDLGLQQRKLKGARQMENKLLQDSKGYKQHRHPEPLIMESAEYDEVDVDVVVEDTDVGKHFL